jgi:membrane fusion protein, multidrug efflux system
MKIAPTLISLLLVVLAACSRPSAHEPAAPTALTRVETTEVQSQPTPRVLALTGTLKADQESDVAANASGRVTRTLAERGTVVARSATLAILDVRHATLAAQVARAELESARASEGLADADCERYQRLFAKGAITRQELETKTTSCSTSKEAVAAAQSRAQQAAETLADGVVRAPFGGVVSERFISVGEYVQPGTKVAHLVQTDPLRVELTVPEAYMAAVKLGLEVRFEVEALPGRTFSGRVTRVSPALASESRSLVFEAQVRNPDGALKPGMFVSARMALGTEELPAVPRSALRQDGETTRAFVVTNHKLEERVIQAAEVAGDMVPVRSGLRAGERVVSKLSDTLTDGAAVE